MLLWKRLSDPRTPSQPFALESAQDRPSRVSPLPGNGPEKDLMNPTGARLGEACHVGFDLCERSPEITRKARAPRFNYNALLHVNFTAIKQVRSRLDGAGLPRGEGESARLSWRALGYSVDKTTQRDFGLLRRERLVLSLQAFVGQPELAWIS